MCREHLELRNQSAGERLISGNTMRVVICGGGVIGACTAYFLSRRGIDVIVVERAKLAAAASGKAGGFLALDWCAGTPLDQLARRSFQLHATLPREIAGDWAYQRMTAYSGLVVPERDARRHAPAKLDWLAEGVLIAHRLGTPETTAIIPTQIHVRDHERGAESRRPTAPGTGHVDGPKCGPSRPAGGRTDRRRPSLRPGRPFLRVTRSVRRTVIYEMRSSEFNLDETIPIPRPFEISSTHGRAIVV